MRNNINIYLNLNIYLYQNFNDFAETLINIIFCLFVQFITYELIAIDK